MLEWNLFKTTVKTQLFFLLLFESPGNLATFYSDFPSGVCCLNAFHLMAYFRNLIWLSASDQRCCGNVTILDCLDAVFIKASHYYWGWHEEVISPRSEHLLYWRAQPLHLCKGCGFTKFTFYAELFSIIILVYVCLQCFLQNLTRFPRVSQDAWVMIGVLKRFFFSTSELESRCLLLETGELKLRRGGWVAARWWISWHFITVFFLFPILPFPPQSYLC